MTFEKALELLKQGKKVRKCSWGKYYYIVFDEDSLLRQKQHGCDYYNKYYILNKNDIDAVWEEYQESLLTDEEKEYLKLIIKFHPEKITSISVYFRKDYNLVYFKYKDDSNDCVVTAKDYFKNLEDEKDYILEELGLEE